MIIPRINPTLSYREISTFIYNALIVNKDSQEAAGIVSDFERKFSERYGFSHGLVVSKARMAFYFLLKNMNLKPGGDVIISAIHIADYVNMIILAGFNPVVVDLKENTYNIDYDDLERKITKNTALMLITHLSGYATDMARIIEISNKYNIPFIEDSSQAVSSYYQGKRLGTFGKAAIFSLSLLKPVCTLYGGMILSNDDRLMAAIRKDIAGLNPPQKLPLLMEAIKNIVLKVAVEKPIFRWCVLPLLRLTMQAGDYFSKYQKTNKTVILRSEIPKDFLVAFSWQQALMGLSQLKSLSERERKRAENGKYLYERIKSNNAVRLPSQVNGSINSFWLFPVVADNPDKLKYFLATHNIDSSKFLLSFLGEEQSFVHYKFNCNTARKIKAHTLFIPMYATLSKEELQHIVRTIEKYKGVTNY